MQGDASIHRFHVGQMVFWNEYHVIVLSFIKALQADYHTTVWTYKIVGVGYVLPPDGSVWVPESELDCAVLCFCPPVYNWMPKRCVKQCVCRPDDLCNGMCLSRQEVQL